MITELFHPFKVHFQGKCTFGDQRKLTFGESAGCFDRNGDL